jgi:hypothetical protein
MRRPFRLVALVLIVFAMSSAQAEANLWDWLDALDGPGPSLSRGNFMANLICTGTGSGTRSWRSRLFDIPRDATGRDACLFFDRRWFHADEDSRFYPVNITVTEFGPTVRIHPAVELGAGIGWLSYSTTHGVTDQEFKGTRLTISFPRAVLKPLAVIPYGDMMTNADWGFLQMYFRESIVAGELTENDFASKPGTTFSRRHQRVKSMGFIIEVPSLIRLIRR